MRAKLTIATSVLLLGAFSFFNVGLPVYTYLCPMMSSANPMCDMWTPPADGDNSVTNQMAACCAKVLVSDRDTTPFLKAHDAFPGFDKLVFEKGLLDDAASEPHSILTGRLAADIQLAEHSPPIFLLHSSFLL